MKIPSAWRQFVVACATDLPEDHPVRRRAEPLVEEHQRSHRATLKKSRPRRKAEGLQAARKTASRREVREAVFRRAAGRCEAGGCHVEPKAMDHFFGRARSELVETCWALCDEHDFQKTNNLPSRRYWLLRFRRHAERQGYGRALQLVDQQLALDAAQHPLPREPSDA